MRYLITGGCGFLGSNLAETVLKNGSELFVFDNLRRFGASENLKWLQKKGTFDFIHGDIRNANDVEKAVKKSMPDVVFHLAGQVAMTTSLENPRLDFEINVVGGFNILEAVRQFKPDAALLYSSTNKVYGDLEELNYSESVTRYIVPEYPEGFPENFSLNFQSPYGCSKGAVDQYMLDYVKMFNLKAVVFRHSSIYGGRQFSTYDQGWLGWFVQQALKQSKGSTDSFTISGNGKQVRDLLYISDLVRCYFAAADQIESVKGNVFNIGGGMKNSLSLLELFSILEKELNVNLHYEKLPWRASDQKVFVANIEKAKNSFSWEPEVDCLTGIREAIAWNGTL